MKKTCGNCGLAEDISLAYKPRCVLTDKIIDNPNHTCDDWEPDHEALLIMNSEENSKLRNQLTVSERERDKLREQRNWFEAAGIKKDERIRELRDVLMETLVALNNASSLPSLQPEIEKIEKVLTKGR